jgi:hypothetical protein
MENIQLLNNDQIQGIWYIIKRDYVYPLVDKKIEELKTQEDYIKIYNDIVETEEYKAEVSNIENKYKSNLRALVLINELRLIDHSLFADRFDNWSIKDIEGVYKESLSSLKIEKENDALYQLNIHNIYSIYNNIETDIRAVLSLTSISDIDTIIENTVKHIDINKHLYK